MTAKLHINVQQGIIEVEGEPEFVEQIYKDYKAELQKLLVAASRDTAGEEEKPPAPRRTKSPKSPSRAKKGTGCAERILALKGEHYFKTLRNSTEVREKLGEKGTTYAPNLVSASLNILIKRGELRRVKQDGVWHYQNP
jgi:hypothetical protein